MAAKIFDGKLIANLQKKELKRLIANDAANGISPPGLAVILVGNDPASMIYTQNKRKACQEVGIKSFDYNFPDTISEKTLIETIKQLNKNHEIDGILVQLPLPANINTFEIIESIDPCKDVDGFHPYNLGRLAQKNPFLRPCTPYAIIKMLDYYNLSLQGKHAVIIGASNIVGRPMALECLIAGATVTVCHKNTVQLEKHVQQADMVVIAIGKQNVIFPQWFHEEQIIIDVGIHRSKTNRISGDIDFIQTKNKVAWLTPVPGGVGPLTISTLLSNTHFAAKCRRNSTNY